MEPATTTFHENVIDGEYLTADIRNPILLGESLSEKLDIGIGNRVVLTFQSVDDELTSASFNVVGIFKTASDAFDERNVRVRSEDLSELLAGKPVYHEIAVMLQDADSSKAFTDDLGAAFPDLAAETWYELSPELRYISDFGNSMTFYIMLVILLALAFGILNTMLMAIFERTRELGMLMAVGMSRLRIFVMIMLESVALTLSGAVIGILIAVGFVSRLDDTGIDMAAVGGESLSEFGYDTVIYPIMTGGDYTNIIILVICTAILSAIYPAIKALRIKPAEVVREK
jgi:ABC-type lipoprotein release transport system permease subunit